MRHGSTSRRSRHLIKAGIAGCAAVGAAGALFASQAGATSVTSSTGYNFGSGYSAINGKYTSVSANWVQPTATCDGGNQQTGFWVGLSGAGTIAQTGTTADCFGTTPEYHAWWEMFPAVSDSLSVPDKPGDHIHASVTYNGNDDFTLTLADTTQGWTRTEHETQNSTGGTPTSANVIAEANTDTGGPSGNTTNFGSVTFTDATANGTPLGDHDLWTGNLQDERGVQEDTVSPLSDDGGSFTATWNSTG